MKFVYLEWADAQTNSHWFEAKEAKDWGAASDWLIREGGWLIKETKEYIVFASGWKPDDGYSGEQFINLHKIPKTWVKNRKTLFTKS